MALKVTVLVVQESPNPTFPLEVGKLSEFSQRCEGLELACIASRGTPPSYEIEGGTFETYGKAMQKLRDLGLPN